MTKNEGILMPLGNPQTNPVHLERRPKLKVVKGNNSPGAKAHFAIDIDGILYDMEETARNAFLELAETTGDKNYLQGVYTPWDEWRTPADVCGIDTWVRVVNMCHKPEAILAQTPFPGAAATLQSLVQEGYTIIYVSNRSPDAARATEEWLRKWEFPLGDHVEVHCLMREDKAPYIAHCQYLIDDRPKTLLDFIYDPSWNRNRAGLSLLYNYNRALTDIPNIFLSPNWNGLKSWLRRKEILCA